jgi:hypothetical protein
MEGKRTIEKNSVKIGQGLHFLFTKIGWELVNCIDALRAKLARALVEIWKYPSQLHIGANGARAWKFDSLDAAFSSLTSEHSLRMQNKHTLRTSTDLSIFITCEGSLLLCSCFVSFVESLFRTRLRLGRGESGVEYGRRTYYDTY